MNFFPVSEKKGFSSTCDGFSVGQVGIMRTFLGSTKRKNLPTNQSWKFILIPKRTYRIDVSDVGIPYS